MGACIPFCIWPLLAQFVHPYLGNYILDNGSEMGESVERQAGAILSPEALRAFFRLFVDWLDEGSNRGAIEGYGSGDHEALAILCAAWAAEYRLGQTS